MCEVKQNYDEDFYEDGQALSCWPSQ